MNKFSSLIYKVCPLILIYGVLISVIVISRINPDLEQLLVGISPIFIMIGLILLIIGRIKYSHDLMIKLLLLITVILSAMLLIVMIIVPSFSQVFGEHIRIDFFKIMMTQINFPIYGTIIILSVIIGMIYIYYAMRKDNFNDKRIIYYFIMFIVFSVIFGKFFTVVTNPEKNNFLTAGLSAYGGLVGVILAAVIFDKIIPTNKKIIKYSIISLPLIYGLTKIACSIIGCCHGIPYDGIFAVTYENKLNIPVFPIQIVETITFLIIFFICHKLRNNKYIIYIVIGLGCIFKFLLDFLRYDHVASNITVNQIFSLVLLLITISVYIYKELLKQE